MIKYIRSIWKRSSALALMLCGIVAVSIAVPTEQSQTQTSVQERLRMGRGSTDAVAWQPNGTIIAIGGNGGLWLYDDQFQLLADLDEGPVWSVDWHSNGRLLAAGGPQGTTIWDTTTHTAITKLTPSFYYLAWQPSGTQLAGASDTETIHIWDMASASYVQEYHHDSFVTGLAWHSDGIHIASSDSRGNILIWNAATRELSTRIQTHTPDTAALMWIPDSSRLLSVTNGYLLDWDTAHDQEVYDVSQRGEFAMLMDAALSPDGKLLAGVTATQLVSYDTPSLELLQTVELETDNPFPLSQQLNVAWSPNGNTVVIARLAEAVLVHWADAEVVTELNTHTAAVNDLAWSPDGRWIASAHGHPLGAGGNRVRIWDAASGDLLAMCEGHASAVIALDWTADSTRLVSGSSDINSWFSTVLVYDAATCEVLTAHDSDGAVLGAAWIHDDTRITIQDWDTIEVWDASLTTRLQELSFSSHNCCSAFVVSPDNTQLAIGHQRDTTETNGAIEIRDMSSLELRLTLPGHMDSVVTALAWNANNSQLVSGGSDHIIKLWDAKTGSLIRDLVGHQDRITAIAWHPETSMIASASADCTVRLWDTITGLTLTELDSFTTEVTSVAWSPDGTHLAIGHADGIMQMVVVRF